MKHTLLSCFPWAFSFYLWGGMSASGAESAATNLAVLAPRLQHYVKDQVMAGAVLLVADKDAVLDLEALGWSDIAAKKPMRVDDVFWIASMSKSVTAAALMMLVDEGRVRVEDPVEKYIPEFRTLKVRQPDGSLIPPSHPITIREILSHTSGMGFLNRTDRSVIDSVPLAMSVEHALLEPLQFDPGTKYSYSNEGIDAAGRIVELVSGVPFERFLQERLFTPLGMVDTTFWPNAAQMQRLAKTYKATVDKKGLAETHTGYLKYPLDGPGRYPAPGGGLFSTALDVSRFCQMLLAGGTLQGKTYLSRDSVHQMTTKQTGPKVAESYGFGLSGSADGSSFGHGGALKTDMAVDHGQIRVFLVQQEGNWSSGDPHKDFAAEARPLTSKTTGASPAANSPWGMAAGAESGAYYARLTPTLRQAGVNWLRLFPEWQNIQPRPGQWNWEASDKLVADARANHLRLLGLWHYFAPWASADGGTRKGPIKDLQFWREYVSATVRRYQRDIQYWEVWNEFDGSFYEGRRGADKVKDYADLVVAAYDAAKKIAPDIKIGTCVGAGFLDSAIKAGAGNHFDFVSVHPYSNLGAVAEGGEVAYLSLAGNLRQMLAANQQRADIPLWITEFGQTTPIKADPQRDARQAEMLVKGYLLSLAQGFQRVFWFETRGGSEDGGITDWGLLRRDWSPRPAYEALKTMTTQLGAEPQYLGCLSLGQGSYGFLFRNQGDDVLAAWAPLGKQSTATLSAEVRVTDLAGQVAALGAGQGLVLSNTPVFIRHLPAELAKQAQANRGQPYPWGGDYAPAQQVSCTLGFSNTEDGLKQVHLETTVAMSSGNGAPEDYRRTDFRRSDQEGHYVYFTVDPLFVPYGTRELQVTVVAKRVAPGQTAGMSLCYESSKGYTGAKGYWTIPEDDQWHEYTWKVSDANFANEWGWNFRCDAIGSPHELLLKQVRVSKVGQSGGNETQNKP